MKLFKSIFITSVIIFIFSGCAQKKSPLVIEAMNTVCTINAFNDGNKKLYSEISNELKRLENLFSRHIQTSAASLINQNAGKNPVEVPDEFIYVLQTALEFSKLTEGQFDPTIGPVVDLWGIGTSHQQIPEDLEILHKKLLVDYRRVSVIDNKVFLSLPHMSLDFGAIAKGYASDCLVKILQDNNVKKCVIDLGGNITVFGTKENNLPWKIGIKNYDKYLEVDGGTNIVTSGNYERYFEQDGKFFCHIINPKTGRPVDSNLKGATVCSKSGLRADILSTCAFILGEDNFYNLLGNYLLQDEKVLFY